jgi:hypothetical protein
MALRVRIPLPERDELAGEPEAADPPRGPFFTDTNVRSITTPPAPFSTPPINLAVAVIKALHQKGLNRRAVVCRADVDPTDPLHWGVIVQVEAMRPNPLEVMWLAGDRTLTNGNDLRVVYRGASTKQIREHIRLLENPQ